MADDYQESDLSSNADMLATLKSEADSLSGVTARLGLTITRTFARGIVEGKRFEDVLQAIGKRVIAVGLRMGLKPLESAFQTGLSSLLSGNLFNTAGSPLNILPSAKGNVFAHGAITPFAKGGIVNGPTIFPMNAGIGLMGERGSEAILPLRRGPDGRLGVQSAVHGLSPIVVNITTPDAESFRRSEAQVAGALARAVARGRRAN